MNAGLARLSLLVVVLGAGCSRSEPYEPRTPTPTLPPAVDAGHPPPDAGPPRVDAGPPPLGCVLTYAPHAVDFGKVPVTTAATLTVTFTNEGDQPCDFAELALETGTDPGFTLQPSQPNRLLLAAGDHAEVPITFTATSPDLPRERKGKLSFELTSAAAPTLVPLTAQITVGCDLHVVPNPLDFGNVPLNTSLTDLITLNNLGDQTCSLTGLELDRAGSPLFSLVAGQALALDVAPDATATIPITFQGDDSTEPHLRTGTLHFTVAQLSGVPATLTYSLNVGLQAYINTACLAGSQFIYTVDDVGTLSLFNPLDLSYTDIGVLTCPGTFGVATPFSMAVDQNTVAWVEYSNGKVYRVDTTTAECTDTAFVVNPNLTFFGMGFVFDPQTGLDTLYVAGGSTQGGTSSQLGTIAFPSMALTPGAFLDFGTPEITGTGDGQLWGFAPFNTTASGLATLAQIDPATGTLLTVYTFPDINTSGSWAVKFWGGSFYLFLGTAVYKVDRNTGDETTAVEDSGRNIVGAGVSTCAPIQ